MESLKARRERVRLRLAGAFTATLFTVGCALLQDDLRPPTINLVTITPESSSITDIELRCRLRLDNPNDVALPIKGGELQLRLADRAAARGRLADNVTIPPHEWRDVDAIVSIDVMSAIEIVSGLMTDPDALIRYEVDGYVDVGIARLGRIRFDDSGEFSLSGTGDVIPSRLQSAGFPLRRQP